jgi:K+-sensing histidine kinase KdpD
MAARAERHAVAIEVLAADERALARVDAKAAELLVDLLVGQALIAAPRNTKVSIAVDVTEAGVVLSVDDAGPALPVAARRAFVALELEPGTYGRATNLPVFIAAELASVHGASFTLADAPSGGLRVSVTFAR